jgi:hypothetical protein
MVPDALNMADGVHQASLSCDGSIDIRRAVP